MAVLLDGMAISNLLNPERTHSTTLILIAASASSIAVILMWFRIRRGRGAGVD